MMGRERGMTACCSGPLIQNGGNGNLPLTLWQRPECPDGRPQQDSLHNLATAPHQAMGPRTPIPLSEQALIPAKAGSHGATPDHSHRFHRHPSG